MNKSQVNVMLSAEQIAKVDRLCTEIPGVRPPSTRPKLCSWLLGSAIDAAPEPDQTKAQRRSALAGTKPAGHGRREVAPTAEVALHEGVRLRAARETAKLTQPELADLLSQRREGNETTVGGGQGVSRNQIHRAERAASLEQWPALRAWLLEREGAKS